MNYFSHDLTNEAILNDICADHGLSAETLNSLHACRSGHPLNNDYQWRNAHALIAQAKFFSGIADAIQWIGAQADTERAYHDGHARGAL